MPPVNPSGATPAGGQGDPGSTNDPQTPTGQTATPSDLGDAGKRALDAEREARKGLEQQLREAQGELKKFKDGQLSDSERLTNRVSELERSNLLSEQTIQEERLARAIERQAAKHGFIDVEDAVLNVDRATIKLDADGRPNAESLSKALEALAQNKPHLVGNRTVGNGDGGARRSSPAGTDMNALIRQSAGLG